MTIQGIQPTAKSWERYKLRLQLKGDLVTVDQTRKDAVQDVVRQMVAKMRVNQAVTL